MDNLPAVQLPTKFYPFSQNNSGGGFDFNDKLSTHVLIEAENADHANTIAERIGIYFNGCDDGTDCSCCGNRWSRVLEAEGESEPLIFGEHPRECEPMSFCADKNGVYCYTHYLNGIVQEYRFQPKPPLLQD